MKKIICFLLAALLLTACGAEQQAPATTQEPWDGKHRAQIMGEEMVFEAWEQDGLPTEGSYYLTRDVVLSEAVTISGQLQLHLNGHKIEGDANVQYGDMFTVPAGGKLVIYDAPEGTGAVVSPRSYSAKPPVVRVFRVGGTLLLAGGTVDASAITLENVANGGGVYVDNGGKLQITGGTLIGATMLCTSLKPTVEEPEQTQEEGQEQTEEETPEVQEPKPAEILGKGGSVFVDKGGVCELSGGIITSGVAGLGGNVYVEEDGENPGLLQITGGSIENGESYFHGGNVYNAGIVRMESGELFQGKAYGNGGNIVVTGTLEITGGSVVGGRCSAGDVPGKRGANILVNGKDAVVHISDAMILDGDGHGKENFGGNICVMGQCAKEFTVKNTQISGGQGHRGGNLYFGTLDKDVSMDNLDFYMENVTIFDGSCSYRGGNLCMDSDLRGIYVNLVMDNCTIRMDAAGFENISLGAGAAVDTWATLTMNGGEIIGSNLMVYKDAAIISNGCLLDGEPYEGIRN